MMTIRTYWAAFLADYREQQLRRRLGHYIVDQSNERTAMSGYTPGYSEENSPMFVQGVADGQRDCQIIGGCPQGIPLGPTPPNPDYPTMYLRGYDQEWAQAMPHGVCRNCAQR